MRLRAAEVSVWGPPTAALLAYAAAHGFTVFRALSLFAGGLGRESWHAEGGMLVVAGLAAALVYDNALIASGRFLKQASWKHARKCPSAFGYRSLDGNLCICITSHRDPSSDYLMGGGAERIACAC